MKYLKILVLAPLLMAFQCESDDPTTFDNLEASGLLGRWEIQDEIIIGNNNFCGANMMSKIPIIININFTLRGGLKV